MLWIFMVYIFLNIESKTIRNLQILGLIKILTYVYICMHILKIFLSMLKGIKVNDKYSLGSWKNLCYSFAWEN